MYNHPVTKEKLWVTDHGQAPWCPAAKIMATLDIEKHGAGFLDKVRKSLPEGTSEDEVYVCESGLALLPRGNGKGIRILGCPDCLHASIGQNEQGYPTVNGKNAVHAENLIELPPHITPDVRAKIWLCARCKMPVHNLVPKPNL